MRDIHIGLSVTVPRGAIMITAFFSIIDSSIWGWEDFLESNIKEDLI